MWSRRRGGVGECLSQLQTQQRTDNGEFSDWAVADGDEDSEFYRNADCTQTESGTAWQVP
eukprot:SAG22_NODE_3147_length_1904_cov_1.777285_2_plen_60_part_00